MPLPIFAAAFAFFSGAAATAAAAGTAVAGAATAAGTALAAGAGTAVATAAAAGTALAASATSVGGVLILSSGAIAVGKVIHNDSIVEAKKRGTVRAAQLYKPRIDELKNLQIEYRRNYIQSETALKQRMDELIDEIEKLVDKHDRYAKKLSGMGIDIEKLGIKLLGGGTPRPRRKGNYQSSLSYYSGSSYSSYDEDIEQDIDYTKLRLFTSSISAGLGVSSGIGTTLTGGMSILSFGLMPIGIIAGPILFASLSDYSKYEDEQFRKECEVWEGRLQQEIKICKKLIEEGQALLRKGEDKVEFLQNEIIRLTELIVQLKFRISLYEEMAGE